MLSAGRRDLFRTTRRLRRFAKDQRGVAAVEFGLVLPIVLLLLLGCYEVPRLVLIHQKVARVASGVADLVSQADEPMTYAQVQDVYSAAGAMMDPYEIVADGAVIITSINNTDGTGGKITWQRRNGSESAGSLVGTAAGQTPTLPAGLMPDQGESVLVAEVYFNYTPIFASLIYDGSLLYRASYTRPRNDNLITPPPLNP
jgi:Flp pilus assembly protein TadG